MIHPLTDLLLILLHWLTYLVVFSLAGHAVLRRFTKSPSVGIFDSAWTGLFVTAGLLQIWHLFQPVTLIFFGLLLILVAAEAWHVGRNYFAKLRLTEIGGGVMIVTGLWLAYQTLDPAFTYDSEAYHFATIRWDTQHPLVPGLANLSIYFGLNQSYFLLAALVDRAAAFPEGCLLFNGFLVFLLAAECLQAGLRLRQSGRSSSLVSLLFLFLALPVVLKLAQHNLSSPAPDVLVNLLFLRFFARLLALYESGLSEDPAGLAAWFVFAASAITLKASLAGFAGAGALLLLVALLRNKTTAAEKRWRTIGLAGLAAFFLVPYFVRGVIASGYPLFPLTTFSAPVDWRLPKAEVNQLTQYIKGFARSHEHGALALAASDDSGWMIAWAKNSVRTMPVVTLLLSLLVCLPGIVTKFKSWTSPEIWGPALVLVVALGFWLFSAPDIRFGGYLLYAVSLWLWAHFIARLLTAAPPHNLVRILAGVVAFGSILLLSRTSSWHSNFPHAPIRPLRELTLASGLTVRVPDAAPDLDEWRIGYANPPATARAASDLALRSSTIESGFKRSGSVPVK